MREIPVVTDSIPQHNTILELFGVDSWRDVDILLHPEHDPQANMDIDHCRAQELLVGTAKPMLRLYSWKPHAVSLGAHQRSSDIDEDACARLGLAIVRRPTGGRAIVHANELTYSVIVPLTTAEAPQRTIHDVYRDVHTILLKALHLLGAKEVDFEKTQTDFRAHYRNGSVAMPCFASSARYELQWGKRKVVGSAQKLYGGSVVLQHGSVLLGAGHERLAEILNIPNDTERQRIGEIIAERSVTLHEICQRPISFQECSEAILSIV